MGLDVVVDDPMADAAHFPDAARLLTDDINYAALTLHADDFVVVATQHKGDHQSMRVVLASDVGYVALIASHKRTSLVLDYLRESGFDQPALNRVRAPAGLDLGARTPEEIALSIIGEIVLWRRKGRPAATAEREPVIGLASPQPGRVEPASGRRGESGAAAQTSSKTHKLEPATIRAAG